MIIDIKYFNFILFFTVRINMFIPNGSTHYIER